MAHPTHAAGGGIGESVGVFHAGVAFDFARGQQCGVFGVEEFVFHYGVGEACQVGDGRVAPSGGGAAHRKSIVIGPPLALLVDVTDGAALHFFFFLKRIGAGHARRMEDMFRSVIVVTAAGYFFH